VNTDTSHGEARHRQSKRDYLMTNRHHNEFELQVCSVLLMRIVKSHYLLQMMDKTLYREILNTIRTRIEDADGTSITSNTVKEMDGRHVAYGSMVPGRRIDLERMLTRDSLLNVIPLYIRNDLVSALRRFLHDSFQSLRKTHVPHPPESSLPDLEYLKVNLLKL
jgi:hypothetical protein